MKPYHKAWLSAHPERTEQWLKERLADGFDVHHVNGDHFDDHPDNLALIESTDHAKIYEFEEGFTRRAAVAARQRAIEELNTKFRSVGLERGAYISKTIKGRLYWYFQDAATRKQQYIGPDLPEIRQKIEQYKEAASALRL